MTPKVVAGRGQFPHAPQRAGPAADQLVATTDSYYRRSHPDYGATVISNDVFEHASRSRSWHGDLAGEPELYRVLPCAKPSLAAHLAFSANLEKLTRWGVRVLRTAR